MPLEGHWQTQNTPLRKLTLRERRAAAGMLIATVVALGALLLATGGDSRPGPAPGCIRATVAGRTGGEPVNACGAEAVALCTRASGMEGPWAESVSGACGDARIAIGRQAAPTAQP
jgi:hypothetical protein